MTTHQDRPFRRWLHDVVGNVLGVNNNAPVIPMSGGVDVAKALQQPEASALDSVINHRIKLVVTDLDHTVYPFYYYFVPAMRKAIPIIAANLGLGNADYDRISRQIGKILDLHGTHEYPWALEESEFGRAFNGTVAEFHDRFLVPFWGQLDHYRTKYLKLYPYVRETLQALYDADIPVVGLSDAPMHMAKVRVHQTGVDELLSGLFALETTEPSAGLGLTEEQLAFGRERVRRFDNTPLRTSIVETMPADHEKPSDKGLRKIMERFGVAADEILMVGDSLVKDGGVAQAVGCLYLWAQYGTLVPGEYAEMIDRKFKPADAPNSPKPKVYPPMVLAATYAAILDHLGDSSGAMGSHTILPASVSPTITKSPAH
ncbi:MAG: HAD family hydrolase [Candidatus Obscuribacterales bacterium]|nr:HAD family hydrolase [Candidatus Obscuribacterales bacterium]